MSNSRRFQGWLALVGILVSGVPNAMGSPELDRQYLLETIGFLKPTDNLDHLFSGAIVSAFKEYFEKQSQFVLTDITKAESVLLRSKTPYSQLIEDPDILKQLSRTGHLESLIRTKIKKQGSNYIFTLDWLHAPKMNLLHSISFTVEDFVPGASFDTRGLNRLLQESLKRLLSVIPFQGHITGRDHNLITVNMGSRALLKKEDTLIVGSIEEVRLHPLLKTVLDWRLVPTGKLTVEQVEEGMAFCRVLEEDTNKPILRNQKIIQIQPSQSLKTSQTANHLEDSSELNQFEQRDPSSSTKSLSPSLGWAGGSLLIGSTSRQFSSFSGGGLSLGGRVEGEIWLTKNWFSNLEFGYATWTFSQMDLTTGADTPVSQTGGVSGSVFSYKVNGGYSFLFSEKLNSPRGWVKLGYRSSAYSLPVSSGLNSEQTGPLKLDTVFLGVGGDFPIENRWGIVTDLNYRLFTLVNQSWLADSTLGASEFQFFLGGYYQLTPRLRIRGGLDFMVSSVDFSTSGSLSQKTVTIAPALLYYF